MLGAFFILTIRRKTKELAMVCQAQKLILVRVFWLKDEFETAIKCNAVVARIPESWPLDWLGPILLFENWTEKWMMRADCKQIH